MDINKQSLRERYMSLNPEILVELKSKGTLTDEASQVLEEVLSDRGIAAAPDYSHNENDNGGVINNGNRSFFYIIIIALAVIVAIYFSIHQSGTGETAHISKGIEKALGTILILALLIVAVAVYYLLGKIVNMLYIFINAALERSGRKVISKKTFVGNALLLAWVIVILSYYFAFLFAE